MVDREITVVMTMIKLHVTIVDHGRTMCDWLTMVDHGQPPWSTTVDHGQVTYDHGRP